MISARNRPPRYLGGYYPSLNPRARTVLDPLDVRAVRMITHRLEGSGLTMSEVLP